MQADFSALFLLGFISGATICNLGCLTHLGPVLLSSAGGLRGGCWSTMSYISGKFCIYALSGGLAGWAGTVLRLEQGGLRWAGFLLVGAGVLFPVFNHGKCPSRLAAIGRGGTLFTLGAVTSLTPCPSMLGLLAIAAGSGSMAMGMASGAAFGLGLVCSPLIVTGGILGLVAGRLQLEVDCLQKIFQGFALIMLIIMGARLIFEV
jgi:hypothetical protein